ncbi:MAG: carbonic anhydrase [Alphaproteobacteria bacterium]|jgi:UDP-perosamine 4-acetyltransferase|nr:carbonic anhydrase [Alphaproteobacteria bacterium]MDP6588523.1 carbonic anhydrase [Alphaproteobacteria bacterium]MDP6816671.1 carbonic anhydrase [Alphaproteobacteria bacterium]|tara:strand:+ start:280 stop:867 length:588 start_codon:yes stop_codon:yes gene_type:complete
MSANTILLVGAGGHAKAIVEALGDHALTAYVDGVAASWLAARRIGDDETALKSVDPANFVLGMGGVTRKMLERRFLLFERYLASGRAAPPIRHPAAHVSPSAQIEEGAIILAGAVVQPGAVIGPAAIVNTGAIVEHDSHLGAGSHLAPRAVLLGGVTVGRCAMIGAAAVVLPRCEIGDGDLVPANHLYSMKDGSP